MRVGIVVPYSWSFWGGVVEHAEEQARALRELGIETRTLIGHDPPGAFSRSLHPRSGRHEPPPPDVLPVGRTVIVPGNGSLPNIVLSPPAADRMRRALDREAFDLVHVHEPLTPALGVAALALATSPIVATFHASGRSAWRRFAMPLWGFLLDRVDARIAVSEAAAQTARGYAPGSYTVIPNGVRVPDVARADGRRDGILFVGRHERRKGLAVLLDAWPRIRARTGARLRVVGADPHAVHLLAARRRVPLDGIDLLGQVSPSSLQEEIGTAKLLVAPSTGSESFGMVLTKAFARATPVVASDIDGYRDVLAGGGGVLVPPAQPAPLADAVIGLLRDELRRQAVGSAGYAVARERYAWPTVVRRIADVYDGVVG
jgi:phosphatidylinositol alpha-mannosyltransferase